MYAWLQRWAFAGWPYGSQAGSEGALGAVSCCHAGNPQEAPAFQQHSDIDLDLNFHQMLALKKAVPEVVVSILV